MPTLTVAGERAYYAHRRSLPEERPPVVFVHGAGGTHRHWLYQVRDLPGAQTYTLDLPGHGRSGGPGKDSIAVYADWLIAFLDAAGLGRVILVGHSMGGAICLDTALRYPARVAGLGLVATGARLRVAPAILEGLQSQPEDAVRLINDLAFGPEAPPELVRLGRRQMAATPPEVIYGDFLACDRFDARERLGGLALPAAVVCGTQDRLTPPRYAVYLRDHIAGASLHLVEGTGHMVMIEQPAAVVRVLVGLADRVAEGTLPSG